MIRFACECGKTLQAREENAGKAVLCPACQRRLTVPTAPPEPTAVQSEEPSARPSAEARIRKERIDPPDADDLEVEDEEEEMADRPQRTAGSSGKAVASLILGILALFCNVLAGLPAVILGILALRDIGRSRGRLGGHGLAVAGIITACACSVLSCVLLLPALLLPAVQKVRLAAGRAQSVSNLKMMGLALQNYNDANNRLPPAGVGDSGKPLAGKPLLSWRVAILPFIGQQNLYHLFQLDEAWDSPNNIRLLAQMPKIYQCPTIPTQPSETVYQVFVGNGTAFEKSRRLRIPADFADGTSNTILIVEAARAVPWTKPEDIPFDPDNPISPLLAARYSGRYVILMADGSVHMLPTSTPENTLKAMITRNGGEPIQLP